MDKEVDIFCNQICCLIEKKYWKQMLIFVVLLALVVMVVIIIGCSQKEDQGDFVVWVEFIFQYGKMVEGKVEGIYQYED